MCDEQFPSPLIDEVLRVLESGYIPCDGNVDARTLKGLGCHEANNARWFTKNKEYVCLSCAKHCHLNDAATRGKLTVKTYLMVKFAFGHLPAISAEELVRKKAFLTIEEACWILALGRSLVYEMLQDGRLERHPCIGGRVTAASVRRVMNRREFDEP